MPDCRFWDNGYSAHVPVRLSSAVCAVSLDSVNAQVAAVTEDCSLHLLDAAVLETALGLATMPDSGGSTHTVGLISAASTVARASSSGAGGTGRSVAAGDGASSSAGSSRVANAGGIGVAPAAAWLDSKALYPTEAQPPQRTAVPAMQLANHLCAAVAGTWAPVSVCLHCLHQQGYSFTNIDFEHPHDLLFCSAEPSHGAETKCAPFAGDSGVRLYATQQGRLDFRADYPSLQPRFCTFDAAAGRLFADGRSEAGCSIDVWDIETCQLQRQLAVSS